MKKINNEKAFTLIEVLLYTVIFAIVGGLTTGILLTVTQVQQRESASAEVTGQLNFIMQRIQYLVRESSNIEIGAGITTSTLKLRMKDSTKDPTCLSLVSNVIKLAEGPGTNPNNCTTNTSDLTSDRVIVNTFNFKKFTQYPGHDTVSIDIQLTYNSQNPKSQVQRTLSSAIARVSAATFDSSLLPGATSYEIGQQGASWNRIYLNDGTAANPSYTFANNTGLGLFRAGTNILGFTTAGVQRMTIDASGNLGIGTTTPGSTDNVHSNVLELGIGSKARPIFRITSASQSFIMGIDDASPTKLQIGPTSGSNYLPRNSANGITIDSSGNVGIGTTAPDAKLEVILNTEKAVFGRNVAGAYGNAGAALGVVSNEGVVSAYNNAGTLTIRLHSNGNTYFNSGNVGIGTASPSKKLEVSGDIKANNINNGWVSFDPQSNINNANDEGSYTIVGNIAYVRVNVPPVTSTASPYFTFTLPVTPAASANYPTNVYSNTGGGLAHGGMLIVGSGNTTANVYADPDSGPWSNRYTGEGIPPSVFAIPIN